MMLVALVVFIRHDPFIEAENATRLQDTEDLRVNALEGGCVNSRLDCVGGIEGVLWKIDLLKYKKSISMIYSMLEHREEAEER